jgi:hypothetical protein
VLLPRPAAKVARGCQHKEHLKSLAAVRVSPAALGRAALKFALWRLARDHGFRPRAACDRWRREDRKIGVAAREAIEADHAIPYG